MAKLQKSNQTTKGKSKKILTPLEKRTKYKGFGWHLAAMLYYQVKDSPLHKSYRNSIYCADVLSVDGDGEIHTTYCKNRWCPLCNRIQMGKMINKYGPRLQREKLWFVTLTRPNVPAKDLKQEIKEYARLWNCIKHHKWFMDKVQDGAIGIRKTECTYNPQRNDYHPHYHFLTNNEELAKKLQSDWMAMNRKKGIFVSVRAQKVEEVQGDGAYLEIFKYFTKLLAKRTEFDKETHKRKHTRFFDAVHMDIIFRAMAGQRVYQTFGLPENWEVEDETEEEAEKLENIKDTYLKFMETDGWWGYYDIDTAEGVIQIEQPDYLMDILKKSEEGLKKK